MDDNQDLNADAIYAGMAFLRDYVENPRGQEEFGAHLDERAARPNPFHDMLKEAGIETGAFFAIPKINLPDHLIEEIFPGEPLSVEVGIAFSRWIIWGPPNFAAAFLQRPGCENEPMTVALSRFIADRAN